MVWQQRALNLLMYLDTCDTTHYVAVLQEVEWYIVILQTEDIAPANTPTLIPPTKAALKGDGFFSEHFKDSQNNQGTKGICPPTLADETLRNYNHPNKLFTDINSVT